MNYIIEVIIIGATLLLSACGPHSEVKENGIPEHSATFYKQHPLDAELVSQMCKDLDSHLRGALGTTEYEDWRMSETWKRCDNAMFVIEANSIRVLF